ncbi:hypothetical protein V5J34_002697 [Endozoicomonas sp. NE35]
MYWQPWLQRLWLAVTVVQTPARGGGGGDNGGGGGDSTIPKVTAVFSDSRVIEGAGFNCKNGDTTEAGTTDSKGEMTVASGSVCTMSLDGFNLGITQPVTAQNSVISTMQLTETGQRATKRKNSGNGSMNYNARVSSLLQSVDANSSFNSYGSIDTRNVKGDTIPTDLLTNPDIDEDEFVAKLETIENNDGSSATGGSTVPPSEAEGNVRAGYESVAVHMAISKIKVLLESDITELHLENELADIRHLLESSDASNGYHKEALLAILEIAEVLNEPEVAERIDFEGSLFDYQSILPKALDFAFNDEAEIVLSEAKGTTDDIAELLFESANRLINASEKLSKAMPSESYILPYEELEGFTYQDSLAVQAAALQAANTISVMSAYQLGDDKYYIPQSHKVDELPAYESWYDYELQRYIVQPVILKNFESEYIQLTTDPVDFLNSNSTLLSLRSDNKYLNLAKQALTDSVPVMQAIDLERFMSAEEAEEFTKILTSLDNHLKSEDGDATPFVLDSEDGTYYANLHAFYDNNTGIDRNSFSITINGYSCRDDLGAYDLDTSKLLSYPLCPHDESILNDWGNIDYRKTQEVGYYFNENLGTHVYQDIAAVPARDNTEFTPIYDRINRVIWCDEDEAGNKVSCEF